MNAFTAKYRPGRYAIWIALMAVLVGAFGAVLVALFRPQTWVLVVIGLAFAFVVPDPKWVKR